MMHFADRFFSRVTEQFFRRGIPNGDPIVAVATDHGIVGRYNDL